MWHPRGDVQVCLPGAYLFVIRDEFGDGLCCDNGNGNFRLLVDGAELYKHNGQFTAHTVAVLQIDDSPAVRAITPADDVMQARRPCCPLRSYT